MNLSRVVFISMTLERSLILEMRGEGTCATVECFEEYSPLNDEFFENIFSALGDFLIFGD